MTVVFVRGMGGGGSAVSSPMAITVSRLPSICVGAGAGLDVSALFLAGPGLADFQSVLARGFDVEGSLSVTLFGGCICGVPFVSPVICFSRGNCTVFMDCVEDGRGVAWESWLDTFDTMLRIDPDLSGIVKALKAVGFDILALDLRVDSLLVGRS